MFASLKKHWPEYLMQADELGIIRNSTCIVDAPLEQPVSPVRRTISDPTIRAIATQLAYRSGSPVQDFGQFS